MRIDPLWAASASFWRASLASHPEKLSGNPPPLTMAVGLEERGVEGVAYSEIVLDRAWLDDYLS